MFIDQDIHPDQRHLARAAASVDGADGPTAHAVLGPAGLWPPTLDPAHVTRVDFEVTGHRTPPYCLYFRTA